MTIYFTAGGLLSSAWVNAVQLVVLFAGFSVAFRLSLNHVGGLAHLDGAGWHQRHSSVIHCYSVGPGSGWTMVLLLAAQLYRLAGSGAEDVRRCRARGLSGIGVARSAASLNCCSRSSPSSMGMAARALHPGHHRPKRVLPTVLAQDLPPALGAPGAVRRVLRRGRAHATPFSSCSRRRLEGFVQRFINPARHLIAVLRVARAAAIGRRRAGDGGGDAARNRHGALTIFYSLLAPRCSCRWSAALFLKNTRDRPRLSPRSPAAMAALLAHRSSAPIGRMAQSQLVGTRRQCHELLRRARGEATERKGGSVDPPWKLVLDAARTKRKDLAGRSAARGHELLLAPVLLFLDENRGLAESRLRAGIRVASQCARWAGDNGRHAA